MSMMKRHLEDLSVIFGYGGEINDDVMKLGGDLHDFYQANGISDFSELPGAGDWGKVMDLIAEQHDGYGTLRGWSLATYHPEASKPELAVLLVFDEGLVTMGLLNQNVLSATILHTFENTR